MEQRPSANSEFLETDHSRKSGDRTQEVPHYLSNDFGANAQFLKGDI